MAHTDADVPGPSASFLVERDSMRDAGPIVIVGGGCAGLSLAVHLTDTPGWDREIVLVEPRGERGYADDRTWCLFDTAPHRFTHLVRQRWARWSFRSHAGTVTARERESSLGPAGGRHDYTLIPAAAFYAECLGRLRRAPRVRLLFGHRADRVSDDEVDVVTIDGSGRETIRPAHVFDGRPLPVNAYMGTSADASLWQAFVGLEVEADVDAFDPAVMTMMDFRTPQRGEIRFAYVLPFGPRSALVEMTAFTARSPDDARLHADLTRYLRDVLGMAAWRVRRVERGRIPMTTARLTTRVSPNVTRIGTGGGLVKPSTGYAFAAIQRHSVRIAASLAAGRLDDRPPVRWVSATLDRIFLHYLARHPAKAAALFLRIARVVRPDRFARFMSGDGGCADDLAVIASMPKVPFVIEAIRSWQCWLLPRATGRVLRDSSAHSTAGDARRDPVPRLATVLR